MLAYLDTTGAFGTLARDTLVADAARRIAADPDLADAQRPDLNAREALIVMRNTLEELPADPQRTT